MGNRAVLCPGCRQIIGSEESRCSILSGVILGWLMGYNVGRKEGVLHYILAIFSVILTICSLLWGLFGARV